jgi:hypothetical protein
MPPSCEVCRFGANGLFDKNVFSGSIHPAVRQAIFNVVQTGLSAVIDFFM